MTDLRSWRDQAVCRDVVSADYDPFFADTADGQLEAIAICAICPVRDDCLTFAVRTGQQHGVWGGEPEQTIRGLIALDRMGQPQPHPVPAGHPNASKTHRKHGHPFDASTTYYAPAGSVVAAPVLRDTRITSTARLAGNLNGDER